MKYEYTENKKIKELSNKLTGLEVKFHPLAMQAYDFAIDLLSSTETYLSSLSDGSRDTLEYAERVGEGLFEMMLIGTAMGYEANQEYLKRKSSHDALNGEEFICSIIFLQDYEGSRNFVNTMKEQSDIVYSIMDGLDSYIECLEEEKRVPKESRAIRFANACIDREPVVSAKVAMLKNELFSGDSNDTTEFPTAKVLTETKFDGDDDFQA